MIKISKNDPLMCKSLVLHSLHDCDEKACLELLYNDSIKKTYMIPDFADPTEARELFRKLKSFSSSEAHFVYGIYLDNCLIGLLNDCGIDGDEIELGYFVHPSFQNRGYATEALCSCIQELFRLGFRRVFAGYFEENPASKAVMLKCGMSPIDREEEITYRGQNHRCLFCEILSQE